MKHRMSKLPMSDRRQCVVCGAGQQLRLVKGARRWLPRLGDCPGPPITATEAQQGMDRALAGLQEAMLRPLMEHLGRQLKPGLAMQLERLDAACDPRLSPGEFHRYLGFTFLPSKGTP